MRGGRARARRLDARESDSGLGEILGNLGAGGGVSAAADAKNDDVLDGGGGLLGETGDAGGEASGLSNGDRWGKGCNRGTSTYRPLGGNVFQLFVNRSFRDDDTGTESGGLVDWDPAVGEALNDPVLAIVPVNDNGGGGGGGGGGGDTPAGMSWVPEYI